MRGRRLYQLQIDWAEDGGTAIELPEADLEPAPPEITTAERARKNDFSTQNWPRQAFQATYVRPSNVTSWTSSLTPVTSGALPPMILGPRALQYAPSEKLEIVNVGLEYDPRLADPRTHKEIWANLIKTARQVADAVFKVKHPKAMIKTED
jgi:hypothetical protein